MTRPKFEMFAYHWVLEESKTTSVRIYGIGCTEDGEQKNICLRVENFKPYCYIQIPDKSPSTIGTVLNMIGPYCIQNSHKRVSRYHLYNTHNQNHCERAAPVTEGDEKQTTSKEKNKCIAAERPPPKAVYRQKNYFLQVFFQNKKNMQDAVYVINRYSSTGNINSSKNAEKFQRFGNKFPGPQHSSQKPLSLSVHENNASPILQLICACDIDTTGWINYEKHKRVEPDEMITTCDEEYLVLYQQLSRGITSTTVTPKIMAFDLEVNSSIPSKMPSNELDDAIFQISCVITEPNKQRRKILLSLAPKQKIEKDSKILDHTSLDNTSDDHEQMINILKNENIDTVLYSTENQLLDGFIQLIIQERPNIMAGFNIFGFDLEYTIKRCERLCLLDKLKLAGFNKSCFAKQEEIKWSSSAYKNQNFSFINWEGILLLDLLPIIRRDHKLDTYTLKNVSKVFLNNDTKDPVSYKDIFKAYRTRERDLLAVVGKYCVQDSNLCIELLEHLKTWVQLSEMARCCNVSIFAIFTQGQQIRLYSQVYRFCTKNNIVVTTNGYQAKSNERYRGALVHEPVPGYYKNVCPLDFASLYPSIIIGKNICYSTFIPPEIQLPPEYYNNFEWEDHVGCEHDENVIQINSLTRDIDELDKKIKSLRYIRDNVHTPELKKTGVTKIEYRARIQQKIDLLVTQQKPLREKRQHLKKSKPKDHEDEDGNKINGIMCAKRCYRFLKPEIHKGVIPTIIQNLLDSREKVKQEMIKCSPEQKTVLDKEQLSYKISANSFYGSFGVTRGYLPFMPGAMTVTYCGREAITKVIKLATTNFSARLVMSDTDSTYLIFPEKYKTHSEIWDHARDVANQITNWKENGVRFFPAAIKLEFENVIYSKFLIVAKKMYLYKSLNSDGRESDKIGKKGVVLARRDNSQVVRTAYETITDMIFSSKTPSDILIYLQSYVRKMYNGEMPVEDFVITKSVGDTETAENGRLGNYVIRKNLPDDLEERQKLLGHSNERDYYISQCPPQVQLAERMRKRGVPVASGSRIEFVVITKPGTNALGQKMESYDYFLKYKHILQLDYTYYAEALINPISQLFNAITSQYSENEESGVIKDIINDIVAEKRQQELDAKPTFILARPGQSYTILGTCGVTILE
jgi:DNA polymerase elongation subunit (family B)